MAERQIIYLQIPLVAGIALRAIYATVFFMGDIRYKLTADVSAGA